MLHLRTPADTAALLLCVEGIATYRNARLIEEPDGWRAICADGVELGGETYTRAEVVAEVDGWLDGIAEAEPEDEGEPMQTYIPHCNRVWL